nr:lysozyme inhibitor LprI family protein [Histidinibacterium aquaticum]
MNACAARDYEAADTMLNAVWGEAIAAARSGGLGDELLDAQRAWLPFRDAACEAEAALFAGGSMAPMVRSFCLARLTEQRTEDLRLFADLEG